ncbi:velvet factor-domain-containing protein [Gilbertella persicaria]|uniref:velvet factor-domain-containing protein n=1 Tax=Gilbertella persicaria TaxID=101096 RepID=UPI00221E8006|nr:velvet factor-domain-containing protein [Gilbertella persicaria]KAI8050158.1 velvet factor-domain-containing protein [Gilbertella persicaria]
MQGTRPDTSNNSFELIIRQQPVHSRMCGIGERVDRRPIDPPPVVQIKIKNMNEEESIERISALCSYLFLIAVLVPANDDPEKQLNILLHSKLTVGRTVSSLYTLRDLDGTEGAFFVFSDISVRAEGNYRLRMCLFDIRDQTVRYNSSVLTEPFTVYSAKAFPGMYRSCPLVQNFAKQGLKIRIRKESGPRPSRYVHSKRKDIRKAIEAPHQKPSPSDMEEDEEEITQQQQQQQQTHCNRTTSAFKRVHSIDTVPNKRRLSLSYLLDQNDQSTTEKNEVCKLAPIIIHEKNAFDTNTTPYRGNPIKTKELPSILHYIPK